MKFKTLGCIVLAAGLFNNVLAADVLQKWGDMHVQISNQAGASCVASEPARNIHGTYDASAPPASIKINDTKTFDMKQFLAFGPVVILSYNCGNNRNIQFEIAQPLSIFFGSKPSVTTLKSNGLTLENHIESSSWFYNTVGQVVTIIRSA